MIKIIDDNTLFTQLLEDSMDKYKYYDWSVAWMSQPKGLYEKLVENKNKIRHIVTGLYGADDKTPITSKEFVREFKDLRDENNHYRVLFIKRKGGIGKRVHFILHTKAYYFENTDSDWRLFIGSANFSQHGCSENGNVETMLMCDQDSCSNAEIKEFFSWIESSFFDSTLDFRPYSMKQIDNYLEE